ncbi:MAG TPA: DUF885 domain-containing protein [Gemmatimonadales bacterium]|nr:DUF885 domain-containing protein [Gemmatimonadales bacterium]
MTDQAIDTDALADRFLDGFLERNPVSATRIGDDRWDDQLSDYGEGGRAADVAACSEVLTAAAAVAPQQLEGEQAVTLEMVQLVAGNRLEVLEQKQYQLAIDHVFGVQTLPAEIAMFQPAEQPDQLDALLARFAAYPRAIDQHIATLREGIGDGRTSPVAPVAKTIEQIERMLAGPPAEFSAVRLAQVATPAARDRVMETVEAHIYPALQILHGFLVHEYAPAARAEPGLSATPNGEAAYELAIQLQTTMPATSDEVHELGLAEVERIETEMDELARTLGYPDRHPLRRALVEDPANSPSSRQQLVDLATERVEQAMAVAQAFFRRIPVLGCEVEPIAEDREGLEGTHYWPPAADGARPGLFRLNARPGPGGLPLYMLPAITFHEAIPGHHFQQATEVELSGLPRFRTQVASVKESPGLPPLIGTGFTEGWGLYAERQADEMGLYASEFERMGMLAQQLLRAVRLVVDTGLHARRWGREQAVRLMHEQLGAPEGFCEMEVDRYSIWPAQALAYTVGQREIEHARREVAEIMRDRFDLAAFHDEVLGHGTLPLTIFRREIPGWVEAAV